MKENYKRARILSRDEAQALLNIYRQDRWVLSKRDFAFFTCRLRMGIPTAKLCKLKWGQIWEDKSGHWIDLGRERLGVPLDMEAWEAIEDYLRASGRLSAERSPAPEAYVFAHLINPLPGSMGSKAEEWNERRFVECRAWGKYLRIYGRLVGIMPEKLTLPTLRYTALAWRLEAGDDVEQMHAMMGSKNYATTRTYRSRIRKVVRRGFGAPFTKKEPAFLPNRDRFKFRSEDRFNKRYLSGSIPPEELTAMLAESIEGLDVEIQGLRILERRLLDDQIRTDDRDEVMALMDMATRTTVWLATLIDTERSLKEKRPEDKWAEEVLEALDKAAEKLGRPIKNTRLPGEALGKDDKTGETSRQLVEEIATARLVIRRSFCMAMDTQNVKRYVRLAEICGKTCMRLTRLLKIKSNENSRLGEYLDDVIMRAITDAAEELKGRRKGGNPPNPP